MSETKLMNINAKDSAKVCAFLYAIFGIFYLLAGILMIIVGNHADGVALIIMGLLTPAFGAVMVWILTVILNWFLKKSGGIRITFK
ncbi:hypothetical protein HOF56_00225 [Candidatus Peribacteria bacterium]|jgi:hypothetical protein|nr:hypothetical protein [Candidatus Peribacteria bacterium]MBT4020957.1 hypothetical protein [Candidatus Peribacteria bacterium]MBT4240307.1 hypothetical protein [Candidatus Peribacteria bacterium]MBT4474095.1 hypothetical protein [Candidatus Peribacteria bacterium]